MLGVVLATSACVYDAYYSIGKSAPCSGVTPAEIRAAIASDPTIRIRDFAAPAWNTIDLNSGREVVYLWAVRGDDVVVVVVREEPCVVTLTAGSTAPPNSDERDRWIRSVEYVAEQLHRALPQLAAWESEDSTGLAPDPARAGNP